MKLEYWYYHIAVTSSYVPTNKRSGILSVIKWNRVFIEKFNSMYVYV